MSNRSRGPTIAAASLVVFLICQFPASAREDAATLPWTEEGLKETLTVGTKIVYSRSGTYPWGLEVGAEATHTFEVTEATDESVLVLNTWNDPENEGLGNNSARLPWSEAFFLNSYSPGKTEVTGTERVETSAGTFETVVVEVDPGDGEWPKQTYWLIPDRPGVYAKFIEQQTDEAGYVMILQEVVKP